MTAQNKGVSPWGRPNMQPTLNSTGFMFKVLDEYADEFIALAGDEKEKSGLPAYIFSHAGDGNLHLKFLGKKGDERDWRIIEQVNQRMVLKALALGGTATGEHGVGMGKKHFMEKEHGRSLAWMRRVKDLFDPNGILNPDKIFP